MPVDSGASFLSCTGSTSSPRDADEKVPIRRTEAASNRISKA